MTNEVDIHSNSCHASAQSNTDRKISICTMHTFTIQGVDQGPSINNIANKDHFIIGQDSWFADLKRSIIPFNAGQGSIHCTMYISLMD
jgi:hypothetical protein